MKKFYILMGIAATAVSAMAVAGQPEQGQIDEQQLSNQSQFVSKYDTKLVENAKILKATRAGETSGDVIVNSPLEQLFIGMTPDRRTYSNKTTGIPSNFCIAPSWGKLTFSGEAAGATAFKWSANNGYEETSADYKEFSSNSAIFDIDLQPGTRYLDVNLVATIGETQAIATALNPGYYAAGGAAYWGYGQEEIDQPGLGVYPKAGYNNPQGYAGGSYLTMSIDKTDATYYDTTTGVANTWKTTLEKNENGAEVSNMSIKGFSYEIPAQSSPYFFTKFWGWINANFTAATTLKGHVYEVVNNTIMMNVPLANIEANVPAGESNVITFDVVPVDEDGDEIEGMFVVDNKTIFVMIENLDKIETLKEFTPIFGNTCYIDQNATVDPWFANSYITMNYTVNGSSKTIYTTTPGYYWYDQTNGLIYKPGNMWWNFDIEFPYVKNAETDGRDFEVEIPVAGGEKAVKSNSMYYNLKGLIANDMMQASADEWITYEISEPLAERPYTTTITVKASALPAGTQGRTGAIKFTGFAQDFTINVTQGTPEAGVGEIVVDNEAATVYYDLQGRKVVGTPDKGIYIVKQGNKVNKVVL